MDALVKHILCIHVKRPLSTLVVFVSLLSPGMSGIAEDGSNRSAIGTFDEQQFIFLTRDEAQQAELLQCPNHAFGSMEDGERVLRERIVAAKEKPKFIQFCTSSQDVSLDRYGPLIEYGGINPYSTTSSVGPADADAIWPGVDHSYLNRLREIRKLSTDFRLLARIGMWGDEGPFRQERLPSLEEVEWQVYAAIGAEFRGIVWIGWRPDSPRVADVASIEHRLAACRSALWQAEAVPWGDGSADEPVTALAYQDRLLLVFLNAHYMNVNDRSDGPPPMPLDRPWQESRVRLELPAGVQAVSAEAVAESQVEFETVDGAQFVSCRFQHGGEIVVVQLNQNISKFLEQARATAGLGTDD